MIVGVVGLGLIGGSFAKAYAKEGHTVYAYDIDTSILKFSILSGTVKDELTEDKLSECDLILVCTYPQAAIEYLSKVGPFIGQKPVVIDCCGTKRIVVESCMKIAEQFGFTYVGGHPMAGTQFSGYKYSRDNLFVRAPMVIVPPRYDDVIFLDKIKNLLSPAGFGRITVTTAEIHDEKIAYTSQLAHIVSNAYIKSPTARGHKGVSAGSYKDLTRVAWLNPQMWTELCLENREYLLKEIDILIENLGQYRDAIENNDKEELIKIFAEGKAIKEEVDG